MRLQQVVKDERRPREFDPREYISTWTEKDLLHGKIVDAWVIIFRTRGCYWARSSGCSMCGYVNDVAQEVSPADIGHQLDVVLKKHQGQRLVKVYTSGNFFDDHEVSPDVRERILTELGDRCDKVIVETLAHLLRRDQLDHALRFVDELEIALGLESTNENVLRYAINKVWGLKEHVKSHPTAGGMVRGAHNCGTCDRRVVNAIEEFSLGLRADFADLSCACQDVWRAYGETQPFMMTSADPLAVLEA